MMRYQDYDAANDSYNIGYSISQSTKRKEQLTDDYEFLENYDFISHLESSGVLKQYRDTEGQEEHSEEIHIDLDFMEDPSFYQEIEHFSRLNKRLERELEELDDSFSPGQPQKKKENDGRLKKIRFTVLVYSLTAIVFILAGGYFISQKWNSNEDAYAFNATSKPEMTDKVKQGATAEPAGKIEETAPAITKAPIEDPVKNDDDQKPGEKHETKLDPQQPPKSESESGKIPVSDKTASPATQANEGLGNSLFIGNSLVVGLSQNCSLSDATFFACQSFDIGDVYEQAIVLDKSSGRKLTILQALKKKKQYNRIYFMFGINEIGWPNANVFINKYQEFIKKVKDEQPEAYICVQSILPVTKSRSNKQAVFSKQNVVDHNKLLQQMCRDLGVDYVDVYQALSDANGYLPEDYSTDGIHLRKTGYMKWVEYLKKECKE